MLLRQEHRFAAAGNGEWAFGDGNVNPQDVTYMVQFVYFQNDMRVQPHACPLEAGDVNCDGAVNPQDVTFYVQYVYMTNDLFCDDPCGE